MVRWPGAYGWGICAEDAGGSLSGPLLCGVTDAVSVPQGPGSFMDGLKQ